MNEWKKDRIASALKGENPTVITRMKSGFVVLADPQFLPGYCILLSYPKVFSLNDLSLEQRADFLLDMSLIGDSISEVLKPVIRINYDILGNTDNYLHAHICPRYDWEGDIKKNPIWLYPREYWSDEKYQFTIEKCSDLKEKLNLKLQDLMKTHNILV